MTAVPAADPTDAALAVAAAAGDRTALAGIYDRYADRLHDFCVGMLRDREAAADCVQDTFCTAASRLGQLREPDKLRPWLYSVARNEALRKIRERRREQLSEEVPELASTEAGPDTVAARTALAELIDEATGGLSDRDRALLDLAYYQGLYGSELAEALEVGPATATKMVQRLRDTVERSLGALLVARHAQRTADVCAELAAVLDGWDGRFTVLMRKRVARHIESCGLCDDERRRRVSPVALLGATPVFIPAPGWLRERTLSEVQLTSAAVSSSRPQPNHVRLLIAAGVAATVLGVITFIALRHLPQEVSVEPVDITETPTSVAVPGPPAEFRAPPPPGPSSTTAVSVSSASPVPTAISSVQAPETVTASAPDSSIASTTVAETTPVRTTSPDGASGAVDEPAPEPAEPPTSAPQPSTPSPGAPARTVPQKPVMTFTPDVPVVTTKAPIG